MSQPRIRKGTRLSTTAILSAAVVGAGAFAAAARADTYSWGGTTGNFSTAGNWSGGVAPTGFSATDSLVFDTGNAYTATNNYYNAATRRVFYVSSIAFNDPSAVFVGSNAKTGSATTSPGSISIYTPFRFVSPNGLIDQQGAGAASLTAPVSVGYGGSLTIQAEAGSGQLALANLTSAATVQDGFQFQGSGTLNFNNLSSNPILFGNMANFTGPINVLAGTAAAADSKNVITNGGAGDVFSNQSLVTVSAGATLNFNANAETFGTIAGPGTVALGDAGGLTMNYYQSNVTFSGNLTQVPGGTSPGGVNKDLGSGHTTYTWTGNAQHAGNTTVNAGTFVLSGNGQFSATKAIVIANGSSLVLDNTAQNVSRINPAATLNVSGNLTILGAPGATTSETVSTLTIGGNNGEGVVNVVNGSGGGTATLTAGNLAVATAAGGFVNFTGTGSVFVTNTPNLTNGILPQSAVNYSDFATIDPSNGNKVIPLPTYQASADPTAWQAGDNVKVTGPLTGNADAATSTVNSLLVAPGAAVNIGSSLNLSAGAILATAGGASSISGGTLGSTAGNGQLTATVAAGTTLTINSNIVDASTATPLVKTGPGTLVLNGTNSFSGGLLLQKGTVQVASDSALGGSGNVVLNGGTLQFATNVTSSHNVQFNGLDSVIDTGSNNVSFTGTFGVGSAGTLTKVGPGNLSIGLFKSSGDLNILQGTLTTGVGDTFGAGPNVFVAAGAALDLSFDSDGEAMGMISGAGTIRMLASAGITLGSSAFDNVTFSGSLLTYLAGVPTAGAAGLTKNGIGSITLSGASNYNGTTRIQTGTLIITADALPNTDGPLGNASTPVQLGFTPSNSFGENDLVAPVEFYIGAPGVTEGRDISIVAGTNGANGTATGMVTIGSIHPTGTSTLSGAISMARATELSVAGSATTSVTGALSGAGALFKVGSGTAVLTNPGNSNTGGIYVQSGALVLTDAGAAGTGSFNVSGGTLVAQAGLAAPLKPTSIAISNQGHLDLNDNDLILDYSTTSPLAAIRNGIANARSGGTWTGAGITSTSAKSIAGGTTTLAAVEASDLGVTSFDNVTVDSTAVLIKYTYYGDLNLDGKIDADDYALIDRGRALGLSGWINGDVDYSGAVDATDYFLMDNAFGHQAGTLSPEFLAMRQAEFGDAYVASLIAAVPEPTTLSLVGLAALPLLARRRRQA